MTKQMLFWMIYILAIIFICWMSWPIGWSFSMWGVIFLLVGILGWKVFGDPVQG